MKDMRQNAEQRRFLLRRQDDVPRWQHLLQQDEVRGLGVGVPHRHACECASGQVLVGSEFEPFLADEAKTLDFTLNTKFERAEDSPLMPRSFRHTPTCLVQKGLEFVDPRREELRLMKPPGGALP